MDIVKNIREHIVEMGVSGKLMRARAIEEQLTNIECELEERKGRIERQEDKAFDHTLNKKMLLALIGQRKRLLREFEYSISLLISSVTKKEPRHEGLTDAQIDRARTYPIDTLVEVKRGIAHCVSGNHADKNASMDVRNGFAYCYACGWSGDSISIYQKIHGCNFVQAVEALC